MKEPDHILIVRHAKEESLRDYITCFNTEFNTVDSYNQEFANTMLKAGLLPAPYLTLITKNRLNNHAEILSQANKHILVKDLDVSKRQLRSLINPNLAKKDDRDERKRQRSLERVSKKLDFKRAELIHPLECLFVSNLGPI